MLKVAFKKRCFTAGVTSGFSLHQAATEIVCRKPDAGIKLVSVDLKQGHAIGCGNEDLVVRADTPKFDVRCVRNIEDNW